MTQSIEDILLAREDAPHNLAEGLEYARRLHGLSPSGRESPILTATRVLPSGDGDVLLQATDRGAFEWCGEATHGLLDGLRQSTLLSQSDKDEITQLIDAATPLLERQKSSGHFNISWTESSNDPDHNVTEADIDLTLAELNAAYDFYDQNLRAPRADNHGMIDVSVYFDGGLHGSTSSHTNHIFLNSLTVISDDCRRRTTTAHELFHRVEYEYGYITGTADQKWWVEALGSWSQDAYANDIKDYIHRVNAGLRTPHAPLGRRSYDACHFWKFLSERVAASVHGPNTELDAIEHFLKAYEHLGTDAVAGVNDLTQAGLKTDLDGFYERFGKANFVKDLTGAPADLGYQDNAFRKMKCGRWNGPFRRVDPVFDRDVTANQDGFGFGPRSIARHASAYGTLNVGPAVTRVRVRVTPGNGARLSGHLVSSSGGTFVSIDEQTGFSTATVIDASFAAGTVDQVTLVLNGLEAGTYHVRVN